MGNTLGLPGDEPDDGWRAYPIQPFSPEEAAEFLRELGREDLFARLPPTLVADPQPSTWLDDWHPRSRPLPRILPIIPGAQLRGQLAQEDGRDADARVYTLWAVLQGAWRVWHDDWGRIKRFSPRALHQAAEILSGEILDVQLLDEQGETVCFVARDRPYSR